MKLLVMDWYSQFVWILSEISDLMLTAAIASSDVEGAGQILACLQQTGLVTSVKKWTIPGDRVDLGEVIPDIVLLDLGRDPEKVPSPLAHSCVGSGRPMRLIACSSVNPPGPELLFRGHAQWRPK